jgi:hypothetical protein
MSRRNRKSKIINQNVNIKIVTHLIEHSKHISTISIVLSRANTVILVFNTVPILVRAIDIICDGKSILYDQYRTVLLNSVWSEFENYYETLELFQGKSLDYSGILCSPKSVCLVICKSTHGKCQPLKCPNQISTEKNIRKCFDFVVSSNKSNRKSKQIRLHFRAYNFNKLNHICYDSSVWLVWPRGLQPLRVLDKISYVKDKRPLLQLIGTSYKNICALIEKQLKRWLKISRGKNQNKTEKKPQETILHILKITSSLVKGKVDIVIMNINNKNINCFFISFANKRSSLASLVNEDLLMFEVEVEDPLSTRTHRRQFWRQDGQDRWRQQGHGNVHRLEEENNEDQEINEDLLKFINKHSFLFSCQCISNYYFLLSISC